MIFSLILNLCFSLIQKCYMNCFQKMLNLTRTIAKQGVRNFTHTTWVSGNNVLHNNMYHKPFLFILRLNVNFIIDLFQDPHALASPSLRRLSMESSSAPECWLVPCGSLSTLRTTRRGIKIWLFKCERCSSFDNK